MRTETRRLYDRKRAKKISFVETVYGPDDECPHELIPWREATEVGQWVLLDDGGACRVIRLAKVTKYQSWVETPVGACFKESDVEKYKLNSTGGVVWGTYHCYKDFTDFGDGHCIPTRLKAFCDYVVMGLQPVQAFQLAHARRQKWLYIQQKSYPEQLEEEIKRDRSRACYALAREDVQMYLNDSLKAKMEQTGLGAESLLKSLKEILSNEKSPANVRAKVALDLLKIFEEPKAKEGRPTGLTEDSKGKMKLIRSRNRGQEVVTLETEDEKDGTNG